MSNSYIPTQQWDPNQFNFRHLQLEHELEYNNLSNPATNGHQQLQPQQDQLNYTARDNYQYSQPQISQNPTPPHSSSSLHGAFTLPTNHQYGNNVQTASNHVTRDYIPNRYTNQQPQQPATHVPASNSYRPVNFNFSSTPAASPAMNLDAAQTSNVSSTFLTSPPGSALSKTFPLPQQQRRSHYPSNNTPQAKRARSITYSDDPSPEDPDMDSEMSPSEQKDATSRSKLPRACARCKKFKVKCEAKTETDPCKRCLNGGHECVIPGRKIRRTPPKREHLLSQIQSQAKEIESLMQQLAEVTASSTSNKRNLPVINTVIDPERPLVLSPSTTSDFESYAGTNPDEKINTKAVADWIAEARQSLDHFGTLVGIGGATMPQSYLMRESYEESDSSDDEEFVEASEDMDGFGNLDDRYEVAVEEPTSDDMGSEGLVAQRSLHHKSSTSSFGTTGTGNSQIRRKGQGDRSKPASLPVEASPFGLFGNLSLKNPRSRASSAERDDEDKGPGIANENFFKPTPALNALGRRLESAQHQAPHILTRGVITPQEAEKLFEIFFDRMNLSVSLLDPVLYTAQRTFYRSPFLFTVICAIASRFFTERPGIYSTMMQYAQLAAGTALISGNKNVEMCQAYILLSLYPVPARKWEDQRTWLYLGLATRTATDINLHLPTTAKPLNENHAREMLNRTRAWLNCLNVERSTGSQYGKPSTVNPRDYILNHSNDWWRSSPHNMKNFDIQICAYNGELSIMAQFMAKIYSDPNHLTGLNKEVDFEKIAIEADDELKKHEERWFAILAQTDMTDPQNCFRNGLLHLAHSYSRLVALSYGFQHAFGKNDGTDENPFLMRCLQAASDVVHAVVDDICRPTQRPYFRHGPEAQSVFVTFASAFLVKLLQPKFAAYLSQDQRVEIRSLVQQVIDLLGSPEVAIDDRHGPKLYSRFLEKLLAKPMAKLDPTAPDSSSHSSRPKPSRPNRVSSSGSTGQSSNSISTSFDYHNSITSNYPSPSTSSSLSPPPTQAALSFDNFAPVGATDPFGPDMGVMLSDVSDMSPLTMGDFYPQPSLPFNEEILQSRQSMTDPSGWQDITLPGFNWMAQFQQNLGLDLNNPATIYDSNMTYLTGPAK
ncbi:hypothetical protein BYT27DRAFT_7190720 [Phlegmacium glaucopus]|nr:hypothetical protein BYT27DRAFT_7190720 [Phlegmacium glaucopus]